jgi:2-polyprenyl-3-methyl-5-hydroxy-6-metoxy-1,4-benzoquinol methylase
MRHPDGDMALTEHRDPFALRAHYEAQGREALASGQTLCCSEPTVTRAVLDLILPHVDSVTRILDVGCGANLHYDLPLADRGVNVVAVDFAESFLALAPRHPRIELLRADATNLPFERSEFDAVICSETVEHVVDDRAVLREIARVLVPSGLLVFTVPLLWNLSRLLDMLKRRSTSITLMEGHLREYTRSTALELLEENFRVLRIVPVPFGWRGPLGGPLDALVRSGLLARASKSFAVLARRKT